MNMSPERFVQEILVDKFRIREAYCGFNYTFGHKAQGTPEVLMQEGRKHGVRDPHPGAVQNRRIVVSSTYIRELIKDGKLEECHRFMGRMYAIGGEVVVGNKLGRTIGFSNVKHYDR